MLKPAAVLVLLLAAALAVGVPGAPARTAPTPGSVSVSFRFDTRRGMPVEGFKSFVVVRPYAAGRRSPGGRVAETVLSGALGTRAMAVVLAPGRYRVSAYQRTCSGTCARLDPASERCWKDVRVGSRATVRLRADVRFGLPGSGCRLRTS